MQQNYLFVNVDIVVIFFQHSNYSFIINEQFCILLFQNDIAKTKSKIFLYHFDFFDYNQLDDFINKNMNITKI